MRLALFALKNVSDVNSFAEVLELRLQQGNPTTLYLRLVDLDRPEGSEGFYLRHVPEAGASLRLTLQQMDSNAVVEKVADQPFVADDRSIFSIEILATDKVSFNNIDALLTIGGVDYKLPVVSSIVADETGPNRFYC